MYAEMALNNAALKDLMANNCRAGSEAGAVRFLTGVHARPLSRSCGYVGLSRAAFYAPPLDWTVRDGAKSNRLAMKWEGARSGTGPVFELTDQSGSSSWRYRVAASRSSI